MFTPTQELVRFSRIRQIASLSMSVTDASTSDVDVFDAVEITPGDGRVLSSDRHQMAQERLGSQKSKADVRCFRKFL